MKTSFVTPKEYADIFLALADAWQPKDSRRPDRFRKIMRQNRGSLARFSFYGVEENGLERRNPLVAILGDSVTAGHFEYTGVPEELFRKVDEGTLAEDDAIEITDVRAGYATRLRDKLIDEYEQTSVNVLNCGIAGDTALGMRARLTRDIVLPQPDLVIINASLNWAEECGDTARYADVLQQIVQRVKAETQAEIILMTPNMEIPGPFANPQSTLAERVAVIRRLAEEEEVFLADAYAVWEEYAGQGYPVEALLANGMNHPSTTGHEGFAILLMKFLGKE